MKTIDRETGEIVDGIKIQKPFAMKTKRIGYTIMFIGEIKPFQKVKKLLCKKK